MLVMLLLLLSWTEGETGAQRLLPWSSIAGQEMKARIGPLSKLDCLYSKKKCFQLKNGRFLTGFRGGPILSLPLL